MAQGQRLIDAIAAIEKARSYSLALLADVPDSQGYQQPSEGVTHIAWQAGHLAMAQYAICLARRRGSEPGDRELMSREFRKQFGKGSTPNPDPAGQPTPEKIRGVMAAIHQQSLLELADEQEERLLEPLAAPHEMFNTLLEALQFCSAHEMMHAGQIGLLRRLLGHKPLR